MLEAPGQQAMGAEWVTPSSSAMRALGECGGNLRPILNVRRVPQKGRVSSQKSPGAGGEGREAERAGQGESARVWGESARQPLLPAAVQGRPRCLPLPEKEAMGVRWTLGIHVRFSGFQCGRFPNHSGQSCGTLVETPGVAPLAQSPLQAWLLPYCWCGVPRSLERGPVGHGVCWPHAGGDGHAALCPEACMGSEGT